MKKRWAPIVAAMGAFVGLLVIPTSAQEVSNTSNTPAVLALESDSAPVPLAAAGLAGRIAPLGDAGVSKPDNGAVSYSKFDIFGGFSYLNDGLLFTRISAYGWNLQATWNLTQHLGFTADSSGNNGSSKDVKFIGIVPIPQVNQDAYFFLFGPTFTIRPPEKFEMFGHFLVGVAHGRFSASAPSLVGITLPGFEKDTNFALGLGGGVDYFFSNHWGWRMVQGDYLFSQLASSPIHSIRISTGIVWRK